MVRFILLKDVKGSHFLYTRLCNPDKSEKNDTAGVIMQRLKHWPNLFHYILGVSGKMADACGPALIELFIIYVSLFNKTTGENWLHEEERSFFYIYFLFL